MKTKFHLIESSIFLTNDITKNVELFLNSFCIISRYAAIQDFRRGFTSILKDFDKICCLKRFFVYSKPTVTLADVRSIIRYVNRGKTGSSLLSKEKSAINEFKMLLLNLLQNVYDIDLSDFLKFAACVCVYVCVCVYALPPVGFFRLHDICDMREKFGSTIFCCEHSLGACAKFLHLFLRIYLISPPKTKTPAVFLQERKRYDIMCSANR